MKTAFVEMRRPALRWFGGKWQLAPWILEHFPHHRIYTEVFGGGASVLLRKPRAYAEIYNDLDGEIVNFFRVLQDDAMSNRLINKLGVTPFAREEFKVGYDDTVREPVERARRMLIRSYMGFGSNSVNTTRTTGFRFNSNRSGTTPATDWKHYPDQLRVVVARIQGVVIENRDASKVLLEHDSKETLHYVDPPYVHSTRSKVSEKGLRGQYRHEMTDDQHVDLAAVLHSLEGHVVLSGYPSTLYMKLFKDWRCVTTKVMAQGAKPRVECLWLNDRAAQPYLI